MNCYFANTLALILDATAHGSSPGMWHLIAMTKNDGTSQTSLPRHVVEHGSASCFANGPGVE